MNDIAWCKNLFFQLRQGGVWGVPRSGLVFTKRGKSIVLTSRMPFLPEMTSAAEDGRDVPPTATDLEEWQRTDYECIAERFRGAGIEVSDETGLGAP